MDPITADTLFTALASSALIMLCMAAAAVLPWTEEELDETAKAWAKLWAWLRGNGDE